MKRIFVASLCLMFAWALTGVVSGQELERARNIPPGLRLNEIMLCPVDPDTEPEWVELYNSDDEAISISGYDICNGMDVVYSLPDTLPPVPPGAFVLVLFDGESSSLDDLSFDTDGLATLHADGQNVFSDEGDVCIVFAKKPHSLETIRGFVTWGNSDRSEKVRAFSSQAAHNRLWNRHAVRAYVDRPQIEGPIPVISKGGSLVLRDSGGVHPLPEAVPCLPEEMTPGKPNTVPAPQLYLPHDDLQTSADMFTFSWLPVGGVSYQFQISRDSNFAALVVDADDLAEPRFRPASPLAKNVAYYWRVRALGEAEASRWSKVRAFTIEQLSEIQSLPGERSSSTIREGQPFPNPLGVGARAARKDSALLCVNCCDEDHWDTSNFGNPQHAHSTWYCWLAAAQMLAMYRGGNVLQDEILVNVRGNLTTPYQASPAPPHSVTPEDSLPHGGAAAASIADGRHALRFALQATDAELHYQTNRPSPNDVMNAINADRPIRYSTGVHAMVVDGYRTDGGVFQCRFLNTDNDGTVEWRQWATEPFSWCCIPDADLEGETTDPLITDDFDGDGMVDFDERERFPTSRVLSDTDHDQVPDKADVATYALYKHDPDVDGDDLRGEVDCDSDNDGDFDGGEDIDGDGRNPEAGETPVHDASQSAMVIYTDKALYLPFENVFLYGGTFHKGTITYFYDIIPGCPELAKGDPLERDGVVVVDENGSIVPEDLGSFPIGIYKVVVDVLYDSKYSAPDNWDPEWCFVVYPYVEYIDPPLGGYRTGIRLVGSGFGDQRSGMFDANDGYHSFVTFSSKHFHPYQLVATTYSAWSNTSVTVKFENLFVDTDGDCLPDTPALPPLPPDDYQVTFGTIVFHDNNSNGSYDTGDELTHILTSDPVTFTLTDDPVITQLYPRHRERKKLVRITGENFGGAMEDGDSVRIGKWSGYSTDPTTKGIPLRIYRWSDTRIGVYLWPVPVAWEDTYKLLWVVKGNGGSPVASNWSWVRIVSP